MSIDSTAGPHLHHLNIPPEIFAEEEEDAFIYNIREEIINNAMKEIHGIYLKRQLYNLVVDCANEACSKLISFEFYHHNPMPDLTRGWLCYQPEKSSTPDSWACGNLHTSSELTEGTSSQMLWKMHGVGMFSKAFDETDGNILEGFHLDHRNCCNISGEFSKAFDEPGVLEPLQPRSPEPLEAVCTCDPVMSCSCQKKDKEIKKFVEALNYDYSEVSSLHSVETSTLLDAASRQTQMTGPEQSDVEQEGSATSVSVDAGIDKLLKAVDQRGALSHKVALDEKGPGERKQKLKVLPLPPIRSEIMNIDEERKESSTANYKRKYVRKL